MHSMSLAVCPHDTIRNADGWYRLVQCLTQRMDVKVRFSPSLDFDDFHDSFSSADLVYANPSDALRLIDQHGYTPLARPAGIYDEALVVAGPEVSALTLESLAGAELAIIEGMLPTKLGLRLLRSKGIEPAALIRRDSWLAVMSSLWRGEAPYGILYRDAYDDLSDQGKAMVQVITATSERSAFHLLCAGPGLTCPCDALTATLLAMADDSAGKQVLDDMHFSGWAKVSPEELSQMRSILA